MVAKFESFRRWKCGHEKSRGMRNPGDQRRRPSSGTDRSHTHSHTLLICSNLRYGIIIFGNFKSVMIWQLHCVKDCGFSQFEKNHNIWVHTFAYSRDMGHLVRSAAWTAWSSIWSSVSVWLGGAWDMMIICSEPSICQISITGFKWTVRTWVDGDILLQAHEMSASHPSAHVEEEILRCAQNLLLQPIQ